MLITLILRLVSLAGVATGAVSSPADDAAEAERISAPRVAQVRLAEALGTADAIHSVAARGRTITFSITQGDAAFEVTATTRRYGDVVALAIHEAPQSADGLGGLSWLVDELAQATAVTRLVVDEDGAVTMVTTDGRRYMAIPGRGSGGNTAVESRWAAEWNGGAD